LLRRSVSRVVTAVAFALLFGIVTATPASAHTLSGPKPSNYQARITSITPRVPGVHLRVVDLGAKLELTNRTSSDVLVLGYEGEPYLRVGPQGVFENVHSSATYVNRSLKGGVIPEGIDTRPEATPQWRKISDGHTARWHDHRAHRMQPGLPPQVASDPSAFHHVSVDHVKFVHDGKTSDATLALDWVPGPSGVRWIPVIVAALLLGLGIALVAGWSRALAVLVGLLVVIDIVHAVSYEVARPGSNAGKVLQFFGGTFVSVLVWIAAVPTVIGLWRRRVEALYGAVFVGLMVALVGGASDLTALWHSQLPAAGPEWLTRLEVALALGLGAGIALGALARVVFTERSTPAVDRERDPGKWLSMLVVGLDESELRRIAAELDVDEVLGAALGELAVRLRAAPDAFAGGALALDVASDDATGRHHWSIVRREEDVFAERGRTESVVTELAVSFPVLLQLLAGTVALDAAAAAGRVAVRGDVNVVPMVMPYFAESSGAVGTTGAPSDRAPAS